MKTPKWLGIGLLVGLGVWLFGKKASAEPPPPGQGSLDVEVVPGSLTPDISVDGVLVGKAPLTLNVDVGTYLVEFGAVSGYLTPTAISVNVLEGQASPVLGTYTAVASQYTLSIFVGGAGTTSPAGGGTYPAGTVVQVTANPAPGWVIDHWENAATGSSPTVSVTMDNNKTLVIIFMVEPAQNITFTLNAANIPPEIGAYRWGGVWESLDGYTYFPPLQLIGTSITYTNVPSQGLFSAWLGDYSGNALSGYPEYWGGFQIVGNSVIANFANKRLE